MAASTTTNYQWTKIDPEGKVNVATDVNTPLDQIDASLKTVSDSIESAVSAELPRFQFTVTKGSDGNFTVTTPTTPVYGRLKSAISDGKMPYVTATLLNDGESSTSENTYVFKATNVVTYRGVGYDLIAIMFPVNVAYESGTLVIVVTANSDLTARIDNSAMTLAQSNETDISTLDAQMAGTTDSGLKTLIESVQTKAADAFPVTVSYVIASSTAVSDKTYAEISQAVTDGKIPVLKFQSDTPTETQEIPFYDGSPHVLHDYVSADDRIQFVGQMAKNKVFNYTTSAGSAAVNTTVTYEIGVQINGDGTVAVVEFQTPDDTLLNLVGQAASATATVNQLAEGTTYDELTTNGFMYQKS